MKKPFIAAAAIAAFTLGAGAVLGVGRPSRNDPPLVGAHHYVALSVSVPMTVDDLTRAAEIVAVVRPTGKSDVHWNNASNTAWTSDTLRAMIYNDQEVDVIRVLRGKTPPTLTIRNIGGTVGDTTFELSGLEPLKSGQEYLVFLEGVATPTETGTEWALSFVAQQRGVFWKTGAGFANSDGLSVTVETFNEADE